MAELFGAIQRGLGAILSGIYQGIPSYGLAVLLLTVLTRILLMPLTIKQMRSMRVMQKIQPQMKEIQKKYKDLQKKINNRQELQELRLKQNQEVMALYKEHNASPAGGCLPLLAQMPVFIALFSLMRATLFMVAVSATTLTGSTIPADEYTQEQRDSTICSPVMQVAAGLQISCDTFEDDRVVESKVFVIGDLVETDGGGEPLSETDAPFDWVARCNPLVPEGASTTTFACTSATGTGHLPRDGNLFKDVNDDSATILGMHAGCSPRQAQSKQGLRQCTAGETDTGLLSVFPYYLLVILIAGTQYFSTKQMMARQQGQQMPQQALMLKIMPLFFGFISLSFPVGLNTYYLAFTVWQIGQQHLTMKKLDAEEAAEAAGVAKPRKPGLMERARDSLKEKADAAQAENDARREAAADEQTIESIVEQPKKKQHPRSKKKKKKRKR